MVVSLLRSPRVQGKARSLSFASNWYFSDSVSLEAMVDPRLLSPSSLKTRQPPDAALRGRKRSNFHIFLQPLSYLMAIFRECIRAQWWFSTTPSSRGKGTELSSSSASLRPGTSSSPTAMTSWPSESMTTEISHRNLTFLVSQHNRRRN